MIEQVNSEQQRANSTRSVEVKEIKKNREVVAQLSFEWEIVGDEREYR